MDVTSSRLIFLADTKVCPEPLVQTCCRPGQGYSGPSRPGRAARVKLPPPATSASSPARWLAPCRRRLVSSSSWFMATLGTVPWWILFSRERICSYSVHPERTALLPPPGAAGTRPCGAQTEHDARCIRCMMLGVGCSGLLVAGGTGMLAVQGSPPCKDSSHAVRELCCGHAGHTKSWRGPSRAKASLLSCTSPGQEAPRDAWQVPGAFGYFPPQRDVASSTVSVCSAALEGREGVLAGTRSPLKGAGESRCPACWHRGCRRGWARARLAPRSRHSRRRASAPGGVNMGLCRAGCQRCAEAPALARCPPWGAPAPHEELSTAPHRRGREQPSPAGKLRHGGSVLLSPGG